MERIRLYAINEYKYAIIAASCKEDACQLFYDTVKDKFNGSVLFSKNFITEKMMLIDSISPAYKYYSSQLPENVTLPYIILISD
ncbi:hypothetical protein [Peribacillus sp. SCS-155]|uniref:hypothetical protein n=1 Tax=Peribacillus sedimenti TaxID=3115297 RepID=UPI0039067CD7